MSVFDSACGGYRVFIGALGAEPRRREMMRELKKYGTILDLWLASNPPGHGYVVFRSAGEADTLVRQMNGRKLAGQRVKVEHARPYRKKATRSLLPFHAIASRLKESKTCVRPRSRTTSKSTKQRRHQSDTVDRRSSPCRCQCNHHPRSLSSSSSKLRSRTEARHRQRRYHDPKRSRPHLKRSEYKFDHRKKREARRRSRSSSSSSSSCSSSSRSRSNSASLPRVSHSNFRRALSRSGNSERSSCERYFKSRGRRRHTSSPSPVRPPPKHEQYESDVDIPHLEQKDSSAVRASSTETTGRKTVTVAKDLENTHVSCQCHLLRLNTPTRQSKVSSIVAVSYDKVVVGTAQTVDNSKQTRNETPVDSWEKLDPSDSQSLGNNIDISHSDQKGVLT